MDTRDDIVDLRWKKRWEAAIQIKAARELLERIKQNPDYITIQDETGKDIATMAQGCGFFFLWYNEFENEPTVMKWLINSELYPGVAQDCFDVEDYHPIGRNPNDTDPI